jgi:FKBP-type peptidyl-prolyl cis-trans isomerase 2
MTPIVHENIVTLHFRMRTDDGILIGETQYGQPREVRIGDNEVIQGMEDAIQTM